MIKAIETIEQQELMPRI